jgi:hypothetical protein
MAKWSKDLLRGQVVKGHLQTPRDCFHPHTPLNCPHPHTSASHQALDTKARSTSLERKEQLYFVWISALTHRAMTGLRHDCLIVVQFAREQRGHVQNTISRYGDGGKHYFVLS